MFRFASPEWFQLLWLVPLVAVIGYYLRRRAQEKVQKAFGSKLTPFLTSSVSSRRRQVKLFLEVGFIVLAIFALARPQFGSSTQKISSQGVELMVLFDVSLSMLAEDVRPSRMSFAKAEMSRLFGRLIGHKIGIIPFAGTAVLVSPLTSDTSALRMYIDSLSESSVSSQGTNFAKALEVAKKSFEDGGEEQSELSRSTRVILIVSDGEDNQAGAEAIARELAKDGVRIFSLIFGTERGAEIPIKDERGYLKGYKKDSRGKKVLSKIKVDGPQKLAEIGKGGLYHATFGGNAINEIVGEIDQLEKSQFESENFTSYTERFQLPLFFALLLGLLELVWRERKKPGKFWKGRFEVSS